MGEKDGDEGDGGVERCWREKDMWVGGGRWGGWEK